MAVQRPLPTSAGPQALKLSCVNITTQGTVPLLQALELALEQAQKPQRPASERSAHSLTNGGATNRGLGAQPSLPLGGLEAPEAELSTCDRIHGREAPSREH